MKKHDRSQWIIALAAAAAVSVVCLAASRNRSAVAGPDASTGYVATLDPSTHSQPFEGWGTSLAWWANVVGGFPRPEFDDYMEKIFDPKQGLGISVVRYNIGGGEGRDNHWLSFRSSVPGYEPAPGQWDWSADANQRRVLAAAIKRGANVVEAFSNSPPCWMTKSGSVTGARDGTDNLRPDEYSAFADYLVQVTRHFHDDWGVTFRTLEPVNEPSARWWRLGGAQEGCHFDRASQDAIVKAVGQALIRARLPTHVSSPDENTIDETVRTWNSYDQEARGDISQINTHTYGGSEREALRNLAAAGGKRLWVSEYGDGDAAGITLSERILADMKGLQPAAWVYWQAVDGGGWGLLVNPEDGPPHYAYTINAKYYVFANYSRFIRPGDVLIDIDDPQSLAAEDPKSGTVVIVTTNPTSAPAPVTYDLSRCPHLPASASAYQTSPSQALAPLPPIPLAGKRLECNLPARSVTTFVIAGSGGKERSFPPATRLLR